MANKLNKNENDNLTKMPNRHIFKDTYDNYSTNNIFSRNIMQKHSVDCSNITIANAQNSENVQSSFSNVGYYSSKSHSNGTLRNSIKSVQNQTSNNDFHQVNFELKTFIYLF